MSVIGTPPFDVSRETSDRLQGFHDLVLKWTPKINLISKSSIPFLWDRHIWDSAQVVPMVPAGDTWVDIGSGGGFPAVVVAIFARETHPARQVRMIESDQRKSAFLRTAIRELDLNASVNVARIEAVEPQQADVVSARALADLSQLLGYAERHLKPQGTALFFKGETWQKEVEAAQESWSFSLVSHTSISNPAAAVLEIKEIKRV
ncbi:16S rRNA (guanine(527)-N(7))-methyltransferase RsmG [uncultured Roseobacter sp.]|uniref:16S rRNA (guanine(527)-N(7))-methyltransferase RsmG n=1 Tax=uncultured Roseobacter sp. TaxID=114847 RepID=UPI00260250E3|nr:16S rRNA (guanine(527)-N(7))-methyltransferase RsmG [uncultured Roseobacter sp.]